MMHLNIRSITNKFDSFKQLIYSLNKPFQVIGLTETWLKETNEDLFKLENYDFVNVNRSTKSGGGVGIYVANELKYKIRFDLNISTENVIESVFIEIITAVGKNIIVGVIYRPPNNKFDSFETKMNQILGKIDKENKLCYLMGDFLTEYNLLVENQFGFRTSRSCELAVTHLTDKILTNIDNKKSC